MTKIPKRLSFILIALIALSAPAAAGIYKWIDGKGVVQYGDKPPIGGKAQMINAAHGSEAPPEIAISKYPRISFLDQQKADNQREILREQQECAALARSVIDSENDEKRRLVTIRFSAECADRKFDCVTFRKAPEKNRCEPTDEIMEGKAVIRNTETR